MTMSKGYMLICISILRARQSNYLWLLLLLASASSAEDSIGTTPREALWAGSNPAATGNFAAFGTASPADPKHELSDCRVAALCPFSPPRTAKTIGH